MMISLFPVMAMSRPGRSSSSGQLHVLLLQTKVPGIVLSDGTGLSGASFHGSDKTSYLVRRKAA